MWRSAWLWYARLVDLRGPMLLLLAGFSLAGAAGIVLPPGRALTPSGRVVSLLALGAVAFLWAGMYLRWPFVPQGRFLLPAGVTALAGIVLGTAALASRITRLRHPVLVASGLWCALLLGLNLWAAARLA